jgi:hypothetical protein
MRISAGKVIIRTLSGLGIVAGFGLCFVNMAGSIIQLVLGILCMVISFLILCISTGG